MGTRVPVQGSRVTSAGVLAAAGLLMLPCGAVHGETSGGLMLGWRSVDVDGDREKYRQHLNLRDGPWLPELEVDWQADAERPAGDWAPDRLSLRLADFGDEPYQHARFELERQGRYRLRYDRAESEYFYDDLLVRPEQASVEGSTGGDYRRFDFERVRDRVSLGVDLTARTELAVGYERQRKRGDGTAPIDVSREEFVLARPIDETLDVVEGSLTHARDTFSVTLTERYRRFDFDSAMFLPEFSEGLDPDGPTTLETFLLDQPYTLEGFEHELAARYRPTPRLTLSGNVVLADVDVSLRAREAASGTDFSGAPLDVLLRGSGEVDQERRLADVGVTFAVSERVELFGRVRGVTLEQSAELDFEPAGAADWDIDGTRFEAGVEAVLGRAVRVALGATAESRDVTTRQTVAGVSQREIRDSDADGYFLRLWYRPSSRAELHLGFDDDSIDDPFSVASPTDTRRYRVRGRYRWDNGASLTASYLATDRENASSGWHADAERFDLRAGYSGARLSLSAGVGRTDITRSIDALVVAGPREALFDIEYLARADTVDAAASWRLTGDVSVGVSFRRYDNGRSFDVDRDDWRAFVRGSAGERYRWGVEYRRADFEEGGIEDFDARVLELTLGLAW